MATNRDLLTYVFSQPQPRRPFWHEIAKDLRTTTEHVERVCRPLSKLGLLTWMTHVDQPKIPEHVNIQPTGKLQSVQELWNAAQGCGVDLDAELPERS